METKPVRKVLSVVGMLATLAVAGFSQENMKAQINFPFTVQGTKLAPGLYQVKLAKFTSGTPLFFIHNLDTGKTIAATAIRGEPVRSNEPPKLTFICGENEYCALTQVSSDGARSEILGRKPKDSWNSEKLTEVALTRKRN